MSSVDQAIYQFRRSDEENRARTMASQLNLPYINLVGYPVLPRTLKLVPLPEVMQYGVMPFLHVGNKLRLAVTKPNDATFAYLQTLSNKMNLEISLSFCSETSFKFALNLYLLEEQKHTGAEDVSVSSAQQASATQAITNRNDIEKKLSHASATDALDILFAGATGMDASDIHIEPQETNVRVRYRIDGVLQEIVTIPPLIYKQLVSRVKYLAHLKLDIKTANQDGRFTINLTDTTLDVRVATLPSTYGEIIDMRLLRAHTEFVTLDKLGLAPEALAAINEAIRLPHGMVLVTGPTGSGKTTTLYAILSHLNKPGVKIITLEDPIEYRMDGIDQVAISADKGGMSFAEGLRGALRQDPDILMVGEIRDKETADIGFQAAMTGHLFLSTLHTNNAPSTLARLLDMGIEPYKIAGAINLIVAQRLVRKLCVDCHGAGCETCNKTGYKGRMPIIEFLKPSKVLDEGLLRHASVRELYDIATAQGMVSMHDDGMKKVAQGLTTQEEVDRVTAERSA